MSVETVARPAVRPAAGTPPAASIGLRQYLLIVVQLALLTLVLRQFQIESAGFLRLALLTFGGFAIHALLPIRYRLSFFLVLSLLGIALVMNLANALWIVGIGGVLVGICHLPMALRWRYTLLAAAWAVLIAFRAKWIAGPMSDAIWPILGSMFMFRMIVYLYDLRHDPSLASPVRTLSATSSCCPTPAFPCSRWWTAMRSGATTSTMMRTRIYQVGIDWMVRGVIHLILYRYVYYNLALAPSEVIGPAKLIQVHRRQLSAVSARIGAVPPDRRHAVPVRLPVAGDPPQVHAGGELHAISGAGSTSTGRTSCRRSSTIRQCSS